MTLAKEVGQLQCQKDSYVKILKTNVISCNRVESHYEVILEDTILFPTGGGQPHDLGTIEKIPVIKVYRRGLDCIHLLSHELIPGQVVTIELDWTRRFDHMQQHSGQHLISDIAEKEYGWCTFGWNLGQDICFVEFKDVKPDWQKALELERMVNEYIRSASRVYINMEEIIVNGERPDTLPLDILNGTLRKIRIGDIPESPCCGTHVNNTSDIQMVKFLSFDKTRSTNAKLWFLCGNRVIDAFNQSLSRDIKLNALLSSAPDQFPLRIEKILDQRKEYMKLSKKLEKEICELKNRLSE